MQQLEHVVDPGTEVDAHKEVWAHDVQQRYGAHLDAPALRRRLAHAGPTTNAHAFTHSPVTRGLSA